MNCIVCGSTKTNTIDSRKKENYVHRRRECTCCGTRFSTSEYSNQEIQELQETYTELEARLKKLQGWKEFVEQRTYGHTIRTIPQRRIKASKRS